MVPRYNVTVFLFSLIVFVFHFCETDSYLCLNLRNAMYNGIRKAGLAFLLGFITLVAAGQTVNHWESLVLAGNQWSYRPGTNEPPAAWTMPGFDDTAWQKGPGGIGYGDGDDATVIAATSSVYLRCRFQVSDPSKIVSATLYVDFDDGFVAYLNGEEIARANLGNAGTRPPFSEYAASCDYEAQLPGGGTPAGFTLTGAHLARLIAGENLLALQVHNCNANSSDLSSSAFLIAGITVPGNSYQPLPSWFTEPVSYTSHLPLVAISTSGQTIVSEPKITVQVKIIDNGPGIPNDLSHPGNQYDGYAGIEIRGQSSQMFPKKSYSLELRDQTGMEAKAALLGMPEESDWVLYAPYSDKTMLRNALTFDLGSRMGRWQPRFRFCELYLNGAYTGVYQLTERIKRNKERVHITKMEPLDRSGDAVTGGYIVKVDKIQDLAANEYFYSYPDITYSNARAYAWTWYYPKADDLVQEQKTWFATFIKNAENTLNGSSFINPSTGYERYFDTPSFIDFQILNELSNNVDGYRYSTFFHKNRDSEGGKLVAGPLWDFDLCYGNVDYSPRNLSVNQWTYTNFGPNEGYCMHWWARLMQSPAYANSLKQRYSILRKGILHTDSVMASIDRHVAWLGDGADRNFTRWPILNSYVWPNSAIRNTYSNEISFLKDWITRRLAWMDTQWLVPVVFSPQAPAADRKIFPNPSGGILNILLPAGSQAVRMIITDIRGAIMISQEYPSVTPTVPVQLDLRKLGNGLFILRVERDGYPWFAEKIVLQGI